MNLETSTTLASKKSKKYNRSTSGAPKKTVKSKMIDLKGSIPCVVCTRPFLPDKLIEFADDHVCEDCVGEYAEKIILGQEDELACDEEPVKQAAESHIINSFALVPVYRQEHGLVKVAANGKRLTGAIGLILTIIAISTGHFFVAAVTAGGTIGIRAALKKLTNMP